LQGVVHKPKLFAAACYSIDVDAYTGYAKNGFGGRGVGQRGRGGNGGGRGRGAAQSPRQNY